MPDRNPSAAELFRKELDATYETVLTPGSSRELDAIQRTLNPLEFPLLPTSYRFERSDSDEKVGPIWNIRKHLMAPTVTLGLYVFGAKQRGKLAYVVHRGGNLVATGLHAILMILSFMMEKEPNLPSKKVT